MIQKKLDWINQQYIIKNIPEEKLWERLKEWRFNDEYMSKLIPMCHSRIKTFGDFMDLCDFIFINNLKYREEYFTPKGLSQQQATYILQAMIWCLEGSENWKSSGIYQASKDVAELFGINHKKAIMPVLFASLMGKNQGPPLFDSAEILGRDITRARFLKSIEFLGGISNKKTQALKKAWEAGNAKEFFTQK